MTDPIHDDDKRTLLSLARASITAAVSGAPQPDTDLEQWGPLLTRPGACFVTLTRHGRLRGCIGSLLAERPLAVEVVERAAQSALHDSRFAPVSQEELGSIQIEISVLTDPEVLVYQDPDDLLRKLRPEIDGVVLQQKFRRATFLPQVWESLPDPEDFLGHLCQKMGAGPDEWRKGRLEVKTYQVEKFTEQEFPPA